MRFQVFNHKSRLAQSGIGSPRGEVSATLLLCGSNNSSKKCQAQLTSYSNTLITVQTFPLPSLMEAASVFARFGSFPQSSGYPTRICQKPSFTTENSKPIFVVPRTNNGSSILEMRKLNTKISVVTDVSAFTSEPAQAIITWQIVVGSLACITPFVVAGIAFSKRIIKQRQCGLCKGSGLVIRDDKQYIRCPGCGGWLPWLSWKRFFTG